MCFFVASAFGVLFKKSSSRSHEDVSISSFRTSHFMFGCWAPSSDCVDGVRCGPTAPGSRYRKPVLPACPAPPTAAHMASVSASLWLLQSSQLQGRTVLIALTTEFFQVHFLLEHLRLHRVGTRISPLWTPLQCIVCAHHNKDMLSEWWINMHRHTHVRQWGLSSYQAWPDLPVSEPVWDPHPGPPQPPARRLLPPLQCWSL